MKIVRMIMTASIASMLVAAPIGFVQANDAHHPPADSVTKQVQPKLKKKITTKKNQVVTSKQSGRMSMGGMMANCPMMSADGSSMPLHSLRMQWHHNMMMWHHQMMHGQSPMHRRS